MPPLSTPVMEDEDEFVDAVDGTEDKQSSSPEINQSNDAEDGFGDDDFGDFGDFAAEGDDEDEDEGHEEYNPEAEDEARRSEEIKRQDAIAKEELKADTPNLPPVLFLLKLCIDQVTRLYRKIERSNISRGA